MKVLVATARTQGDRPNDYHFCIEGELVRIDEVCARDHGDPDGGCGCGRGFGGLNSHRATTTARIAEVSLSLADYALAIRSSLEQQGGTRARTARCRRPSTWPRSCWAGRPARSSSGGSTSS